MTISHKIVSVVNRNSGIESTITKIYQRDLTVGLTWQKKDLADLNGAQ